MHCSNCGQERLKGAKFCENCGMPESHKQVNKFCARCGSPNQPEAEFCAECGARLGVEVIPIKAFCPECGATVKEGAVFCQECGADLNATTAPVPFVCPECGEPLRPDAAFCGNCGRVLQQGGEYVSAAPEVPTAMEYQPSYPPETQNYSPQQDWVQPKPQNSNRNKMLMAAAAAVILLVIGITGFWKPGYLLDLFRPTAKLENGMLALKDITLDFKQTNLSNGKATMTTVKDKEYEIQSGLIGDLYVMNIDKSCQGKVTVSIPTPKDFKPTTGNGLYIKLGIGRDYELEDGNTERRYSYFDAEIKDGKAVAVIDPAALGQGQLRNKAAAKQAKEEKPDVGKFTEYVGLFFKEGLLLYGEGYQYSKGHFRLWYDYNPTRVGQYFTGQNIYMRGGDAQNLLNDLEEAYNYYKTHGYAEHVDTFTPIDVYITRQWKLFKKDEGTEGTWDPTTGNIELNEQRLFDEKGRYEGETRKKVRATIYHEVFHAVQQSLIGSRAYIYDTKNSNWFDEATGTNFERLVSRGLTNNEQHHFWRLWQGPIPEGSGMEDGYSRGLLINYMSSKLGGDAWIKDCYKNWSKDYRRFKSYMKKIAPSEADFAAKFYLELIEKLGGRYASWYYIACQNPDKDEGQERYLSAIRLELDAKAKDKIENGAEGEDPIVFTSPPFELKGYGGRIIALVTKDTKIRKDLDENYPDKCQLKLEAEGDCRIQVLKFKGPEVVSSNDTIIKDFKEQLNKKYLYLALVTSTKPTKQNVVLKATLEKEDLKEGIYNGKAVAIRGGKSETVNNEVGFRLTKGKDGLWGLNICQANGDYYGTTPNVPLTYDAKQKRWKGHRKIKEELSKDPKESKLEVSNINCAMKVNLEGKEPVLIVDYLVVVTRNWGDVKKKTMKIHFEGKWSSELKGKIIDTKTRNITILE